MKHLLLFFALFSILVSCQKDQEVSLEYQINEFIEQQMKDVYLWADNVSDRNVYTEQDPFDFLVSMMYTEQDRWSSLELSEGSTKVNIDGDEVTFGYKVKFWALGANSIVGVIQYVYPNSPAAIAGLKRGDIVVMNNGEYLNKNNYLKVVQDSKVSLKMGTVSKSTISSYEEKVYELSSQEMSLNPILLDTILEVGNKKVGYFVYSQFINNEINSLSDLSEAIGKMKAEFIDEFILDLRYNTGGSGSAAKHLASLLAPASVVANSEILICNHWNNKYQERYQNTSKTEVTFDPSVLPDNLDLSRICILTGEWTASASELVISGLEPYIPNMTLIGENTYGKYVGMSQIRATEDLQQWTLWPVTFTYSNSAGKDVKGGIWPSIYIKEDVFNLSTFGSSEDIVLARAIQFISEPSTLTTRLQSRNEISETAWKLLDGDTKYLLVD